MDMKTLRAQTAHIPDDAQVNVMLGDTPWGIDGIIYDPALTVVPGTSGQVLKPTFSIYVDFDAGSM